MRTSTKLAMAFLAVATTAGAPAFADQKPESRAERGKVRFERTDTDSSGDITFQEFAAAMEMRIGDADKDGDGKMTVAEIAAAIERMRAERAAERMIQRFDADGDGMLTLVEIETQQKKMFALLDRNNDGKLVPEEMPRREGDRGRERKREGDAAREGDAPREGEQAQ
jgi:Ca2+-binding EF-hand superfamily protein